MNMRKLMLMGGGLALSLSLPATAFATPVVLKATLSGANESNGGDPDGSGSFSTEIDTDTGDVCYVLAVKNIGAAMAAHVHEGAAGADGKPVMTVDVTGADEDLCMAVEPGTLAPIVATPENYYVNVHTKDFPSGAIRGQLINPAAPASAPAAATQTPAAAATQTPTASNN